MENQALETQFKIELKVADDRRMMDLIHTMPRPVVTLDVTLFDTIVTAYNEGGTVRHTFKGPTRYSPAEWFEAGARK